MTAESIVETPASTEIKTGDAAVTPEVAEPEKVEEPASKAEESAEQRALKAAQRRIDRLTRDKYELRARLEQSASRQPGQEVAQEPRYTEQDIERVAAARIAAQQATERANSIASDGEKSFPDFGKKVRTVMEELPLFDAKGLPTPAMEAIYDAERPAALLHYLGEHPDIAAELADLTPVRQARRIALIERDLPAPKTADAAKTPSPVSKAPAPLKPGRPSSTSVKSPGDMSDAEWAAWKEEQRRQGKR